MFDWRDFVPLTGGFYQNRRWWSRAVIAHVVLLMTSVGASYSTNHGYGIQLPLLVVAEFSIPYLWCLYAARTWPRLGWTVAVGVVVSVGLFYAGIGTGSHLYLRELRDEVRPYSVAAEELSRTGATSSPLGRDLDRNEAGWVRLRQRGGVFYVPASHTKLPGMHHVEGNWYSSLRM